MSRPRRIEFPGAIDHVTSRGDRREPIYRDDIDRNAQLDVIAQAMDRFDAQELAYCQMGNHYHLVLHTRQANLSRLLRHVNGVYTQAYNRRHGLVGHRFQGRFSGGGRAGRPTNGVAHGAQRRQLGEQFLRTVSTLRVQCEPFARMR